MYMNVHACICIESVLPHQMVACIQYICAYTYMHIHTYTNNVPESVLPHQMVFCIEYVFAYIYIYIYIYEMSCMMAHCLNDVQ
jgi:hypothetical protein